MSNVVYYGECFDIQAGLACLKCLQTNTYKEGDIVAVKYKRPIVGFDQYFGVVWPLPMDTRSVEGNSCIIPLSATIKYKNAFLRYRDAIFIFTSTYGRIHIEVDPSDKGIAEYIPHVDETAYKYRILFYANYHIIPGYRNSYSIYYSETCKFDIPVPSQILTDKELTKDFKSAQQSVVLRMPNTNSWPVGRILSLDSYLTITSFGVFNVLWELIHTESTTSIIVVLPQYQMAGFLAACDGKECRSLLSAPPRLFPLIDRIPTTTRWPFCGNNNCRWVNGSTTRPYRLTQDVIGIALVFILRMRPYELLAVLENIFEMRQFMGLKALDLLLHKLEKQIRLIEKKWTAPCKSTRSRMLLKN